MIRAAIFDFDGTLFDSMYVWKNVTERYLKTIGIEARGIDDRKLKALSLPAAASWVKDEFSLSLNIDEIVDGFNDVVRFEYENNVLPKKGVREFLDELKKLDVKMAVATLSEYEHIISALDRCQMRDYFSDVFSCSNTLHGKRRPDIFNSTMEHLKKQDGVIDKKNTFVFEDALYALKTAKADGFVTVGVYDESEEEADELRSTCDVYIQDFCNTGDFWKFTKEQG